uniref:Uncharacterized protein n=1 Tax=Glossina pallidipes TaxID=7398 RepID=A0A1A9Z7F3_GLOPL
MTEITFKDECEPATIPLRFIVPLGVLLAEGGGIGGGTGTVGILIERGIELLCTIGLDSGSCSIGNRSNHILFLPSISKGDDDADLESFLFLILTGGKENKLNIDPKYFTSECCDSEQSRITIYYDEDI